MLEKLTLDQLLVFLFSAGTIAVLLQRIPGWDALDGNIKKGIVAVLGVALPFILGGLRAYIPTGDLNTVAATLVIGAFTAAATFVIHLIDEWLSGLGR